MIAIVPMVGTGRDADFKRPLFVPLALDGKNGLISYRIVESDDKAKAIVELVFVDRKSLLAAMGEANRLVATGAQPALKAFEFGAGKDRDIEVEARKIKKDFTLDQLRPLPAKRPVAATVQPGGGK